MPKGSGQAAAEVAARGEELVRAYKKYYSDLVDGLTKNVASSNYGFMLWADERTGDLNELDKNKGKLRKILQDRIEDLDPGIIRPQDAQKEEKVRAIFTDHPEKDSFYIRMQKALDVKVSWSQWLKGIATSGNLDNSGFKKVMEVIFNGYERQKIMKERHEIMNGIARATKLDELKIYPIMEGLENLLYDYYNACCQACSNYLLERRDMLKKGLETLDAISTNELARCYLIVTAVCGKKRENLQNLGLPKGFTEINEVDFRGVVGKQCLGVFKELNDLRTSVYDRLLKQDREHTEEMKRRLKELKSEYGSTKLLDIPDVDV